MNNLYNKENERKLSLDEIIKQSSDRLNDIVSKKAEHFSGLLDIGGPSDYYTMRYFIDNYHEYIYPLFYAYDGDGAHPRYNLFRLMVLKDSNASNELLRLTAQDETFYEYVYFAITNDVEQNEIISLINQVRLGEVDENGFYQSIIQQRRDSKEIHDFAERDIGVRTFTTVMPTKFDSGKSMSSSLVENEKMVRINEIKQEYSISNKLARVICNNKVTSEIAINILKDMEVNGVDVNVIKRMIRGNVDDSFSHLSKDITDFNNAQYNHKMRLSNKALPLEASFKHQLISEKMPLSQQEPSINKSMSLLTEQIAGMTDKGMPNIQHEMSWGHNQITAPLAIFYSQLG